jgi:hypothetical protein
METDEETLPPGGAAAEDLSVFPTVQAARSLLQTIRPFDQNITEDDVKWNIRGGIVAISDNQDERILYGQMRVLDALFHRVTVKAMKSPQPESDGVNYVDDERLVLALRAQHQCRQTLDSIRARRPPPKK